MENLSVLFHETGDFLNDNKLTDASNGEKLIDETLNAKGSTDDNIIDCTKKEDTLDVISRPIWENMAESPTGLPLKTWVNMKFVDALTIKLR
ncbi:hypothetical protein L2E82_06254 [Cichorium intybus]|uniref:Uncharacterized protein n=1 Tax=Cichorium intybus TaxID=13427 RepID=A0ACB9H9Z8_CICIN|nr:hypothetical protein L2E82_06254 [Cichorium intybus]